jgi:hypothetical protein
VPVRLTHVRFRRWWIGFRRGSIAIEQRRGGHYVASFRRTAGAGGEAGVVDEMEQGGGNCRVMVRLPDAHSGQPLRADGGITLRADNAGMAEEFLN